MMMLCNQPKAFASVLGDDVAHLLINDYNTNIYMVNSYTESEPPAVTGWAAVTKCG